jgi:hypothetical protein
VDVAADAVEDHRAGGRGVELGARAEDVLPEPEDLVDDVPGVDLEFVIGVFAGDEDLEVVLLVDFRIALGEGGPDVGLLGPESEVEVVVVPEDGDAGVEPGGVAGDDVDEGAGFWGELPGGSSRRPSMAIGPAARWAV